MQSLCCSSLNRHALAGAIVVLLAACGGRAPAASGPAPLPGPSVAPMQLSGQRVLVLPVQSVTGTGQSRADATREILFALSERDPGTRWVDPDQLRASLRRSPGYAAEPDVLPVDAFRHHRERYVVEPLGGLLRRYSALMDTRVVLIPQSALWVAQGDSGRVRMAATMVDTRSSNVVWYGEADGEMRAAPDPAAMGTAAAALAAKMVVATSP